MTRRPSCTGLRSIDTGAGGCQANGARQAPQSHSCPGRCHLGRRMDIIRPGSSSPAGDQTAATSGIPVLCRLLPVIHASHDGRSYTDVSGASNTFTRSLDPGVRWQAPALCRTTLFPDIISLVPKPSTKNPGCVESWHYEFAIYQLGKPFGSLKEFVPAQRSKPSPKTSPSSRQTENPAQSASLAGFKCVLSLRVPKLVLFRVSC